MEGIQDDWWPRTDCPGKSNTARNDLNKNLWGSSNRRDPFLSGTRGSSNDSLLIGAGSCVGNLPQRQISPGFSNGFLLTHDGLLDRRLSTPRMRGS